MDNAIDVNNYAAYNNPALLARAMAALDAHTPMAFRIGTLSCYRTNYAVVKPAGYVQLRLHGRKFYGHVVACIFNAGRVPVEGEQASHRCHRGACVNPQHLVFETERVNKTRQYCDHFKDHPDHNCLHQPQCIRVHGNIDTPLEGEPGYPQ